MVCSTGLRALPGSDWAGLIETSGIRRQSLPAAPGDGRTPMRGAPVLGRSGRRIPADSRLFYSLRPVDRPSTRGREQQTLIGRAPFERPESGANRYPLRPGTGAPPPGPGTAGQANVCRGLVGVGPGTCPGTKVGQAARSRPQGPVLRSRAHGWRGFMVREIFFGYHRLPLPLVTGWLPKRSVMAAWRRACRSKVNTELDSLLTQFAQVVERQRSQVCVFKM